eukprot:6212686-Pleurochrysis_carterae.AAC.4
MPFAPSARHTMHKEVFDMRGRIALTTWLFIAIPDRYPHLDHGPPVFGLTHAPSGEIGSDAVAKGLPRPPPLTDPRLPPRPYPCRGRGSVSP